MSKIQVTARQRANAIEARDIMWPSVPPENVYPKLGWYRKDPGVPTHNSIGIRGNEIYILKPPSCETLACFSGWCAWWPPYHRQGVQSSIVGSAVIPENNSSLYATYTLFGDCDLSSCRDGHVADREFKGTDHELVTHRLNWLIKNSEVIDAPSET